MIEAAADARFAVTAYADAVGSMDSLSVSDLERMQDRWCLWIAADRTDEPVGFAWFETVDAKTQYLGQVSILPDHAGYSVGARLIDAALRFYGDRGAERATLTTFRDVPWNGPYYARLGFRLIQDLASEAHLSEQIDRQVALGLPRESRIAMVRPIASADHQGDPL